MEKVKFSKTRIPLVVIFLAALVLPFSASQEAFAAGPCRVNGYTIHARLQMSTRDISKSEVQESVSTNCAAGKWQPKSGTWLYQSKSGFLPTVVLNNSGWVITTYWGSGGGGSSIGSWSFEPIEQLL